jgi:hypothetical protein
VAGEMEREENKGRDRGEKNVISIIIRKGIKEKGEIPQSRSLVNLIR